MDHPDNTENLNISLDSEYFLDKQSNPAENDFIAELFQTHFDEETGVENVNGHVEETHNSDVDLPVPTSPEMEREKTPEAVTEVKSLIERLKQDQIDFKEKYFEAQSLLVDYENKLSEYMNSTMKLQKEVDALKESNQAVVAENTTLKNKLDEKEAELKQFKGLVQKQVTSEEDIYVLKKEMAEITKALKKSEKMYATSMDLHNKRIKQMVKYKRNYKKVMSQLLECSEILISNNLLPLKHIKNLEHFMESCKDINLDSEGISEDSSLSLEEENSIHSHSAESNTLTNGTYIKPNDNIISPNEESTKSCSSSGYLSSANTESSTNLKLSPLHQNLPSDTKGIHCEVSKNDNSHVFQLPFSPAKSKAENSLNEEMQKNKIIPNNATEAAVNSRFSGDMEVTDDFINLREIMGSMVMKVEDLNLISPIPESPLKKMYSYSDKIKSRKNDSHTQAPYKNSSIMPKDISPIQSNDYKKNRFSHQTSSGFEPHIEEKSESIDSSTSNTAFITGNPFQTPISPNLHYLSSSYTNNTFQILHQGSSALDYIANSDTKFTAFVLTIPKKSSRNGIHNNKDDYVLPCIEERLSSVQSLYNAAIKPETSIKKGIFDSRENKTENSVNDPFSYICVQIDSKNGQINLKSNLENNSMSDNHSSPCLTIEEKKSGQINLNNNQRNNYVSNKHSNPCFSTKKQLSEVVHEENLIPEYMEQEKDDNQPFVSDSCSISPHNRKLAKTLHYHDVNENGLNTSKNENNLPIIDKVIGNYNESSETNHSSESKGNRSLLPNEINKPRYSLPKKHSHVLSVESEKSLDMSLKKQFSTFGDQNGLKSSFVETADKVPESSGKEDNFVLNTSNSNSRKVTNETAVLIFDNDKTTISSPESNNFVAKNMDEDMQSAAAYDKGLQNSLSPLKDGVNFILNTYKLNSEAAPSETAISVLESNGTSDKMTTSTPKCISIGKNKSVDEMNFAVTYDNLQSNLSLVKQKLFQDSDSKSHTLPSFKSKSYDTFDNSDKSEKETEKTIKHPCLSSKSVINSNSDKEISNTVVENKKLHNFSNSSTENVLLTDIELPASKKRKLLKSPSNLFSKNESIPTLDDKSPDHVKMITESSPKTTENFQSSIHLINNTTVDKSYGVFKTDDDNFSSSCDEERNTTLNKITSVDSPENIEKDAKQAYLKSPNVIANKEANDSFGKSNSKLSNASKKRKRKPKNKRKKKDLSSSIGICPKNSEKSPHGEISQHITSFRTGLESNLKSLSSDKKVSQTDSKQPSSSILGQKEIKRDLNSPGLKKNHAVEFNTQINSGTKVSNKSSCDIPSLENTITKRKEKFFHPEPLNVQEIVNSSKSSEEKETSSLDIDEEKLTDNLSIKELSNNQIKMIEKNGKVDSNPEDFETNIQINSGTEVNYENNCNIASLEDTVTKTKGGVILSESFNIQEVVHSRKSSEKKSETCTLNTDKEELTDKDNLSTIKVSNNQLEIIQENGKINLCSDLPSENLLNHKAQYNQSSFSHVNAPESIEAGIKQELCLKEPVINTAAAGDISSEEHSKVSISHTFENIENLDDSIISDDENPLVIADDDDECNSIPETTSNIANNEAPAAAQENPPEENNEVTSSSEIEKPAKNKKKKRKHSKAHNTNKRKKSQSSCEEESICNSCTIESALDDIKKMKFEEMLTNHSKYKLLLHKLISALINPANAPNATSALYQIFSFLSFSKLNPLVSYLVKKNTSVFFPPAENCIVEALIKTESKKKLHLQGLIPSAISTLYYLILDKKTISKTGLGALCRIFTQLCKLTQNKQKPIKLTCDLIKEQHPLAPVLVAFIIGTWVELFEPPEDKDVFRILHLSCIYFGLQKKPSTVTSADWNACKAVFNMTSLPPLPTDLEETINVLISSVENLVTGPPSETDEWACDQILIIAVTKGWTWTQEKLVNRLIGFLSHYAKDVNNERAFSLYAELCADIGKQEPGASYTILEALSELILADSEFGYVRKHAAQSLLKLLLFKHLPIPELLTEYIQENENNLNTNVELYLRRRCIADVTDLTESDILIT